MLNVTQQMKFRIERKKWREKFFREEYLKADKITGSEKHLGMGNNKDN